jgi:methylated-DNA-[protein]-cysteine S-methyltransferase
LAWDDNQNALKRSSLAQSTRGQLLGRLGGTIAEAPPEWVLAVADRITSHLTGQFDDFEDVALDMSGMSDLNARIYRRLRAVHAGATITYGALAAELGEPGAARRVGQAMAVNPFPLLVPCHRVVAANGQPGGFSAFGGVDTKDQLLAIEGVILRAQGELF